MIDERGKYPMLNEDSILIPTGMATFVGIKATSVTSGN